MDEQEYIDLCKKQIEERYAFGNGSGYTQRDLEQLAETIQEKSGIRLSLSTLKRLWKGKFKQSPQVATLNGLATLLDHKDWQSFKLANKPVAVKEEVIDQRQVFGKKWWLLAGAALVLIIVLLVQQKETEPPALSVPEINGAISFSTKKTVTRGIPNTVIFSYDVSNVKADSFYIQQSWNDYHKVAIDPEGNAFSSIYYESGYHRARLLANDSAIAMQPVHILSDGWEPHVYYNYEVDQPIHFENEKYLVNGTLHLSPELLKKRNVDTTRYFFSRISYSDQFEISSDDFSLTSRIKVDKREEKLCPWMQVIVVTEKHIFYVNVQAKGCERNIQYKLGEVYRSGENYDMSGLGADVYDWQEVGVEVQDRHAEILMNGVVVYRETYKEDFGKIMGLIYLFDGTGSIDQVRLADGNGAAIFEDDFSGGSQKP